MENWWGVLIAIASGALMSVQGVFNTQLTKQTSLWVTSSFVQFSALLVCLLAWLCTDRSSFSTLMKVTPKYMLVSGILGALITITVVWSMKGLGPARAAMLIVISQLIVAYVIELMGFFGVEKQGLEVRRLAGLGLAIVGVVIFKW